MSTSSHSPTGEPSPFTAPPQGTVTVLIADPHGCVREGLRAILERDTRVRVVGEAGDESAAVTMAADLSPGVVVLDANLLGRDGPHVVAKLRQAHPYGKVLVLTGCGDAGTGRRCLGAGARGYVLKTMPLDQLVLAVRSVAAGGTVIDPELAGAIIGPSAGVPVCGELSDRETLVLRGVAVGYSNKELAAQLKLSVKTVETYKGRALEKLGLRTRVDIVRHAARCGWLTGGDTHPPQDDVA